jgi:Mitosis protein DIM1
MDNKQEVRLLCVSLNQGPNSLYCQLIDIIETVYRGASKGRGLVVSPKGTVLLVCPAPFVKLIGFKRLLDTVQVLRMPIAIPSSFLLSR